MVITTDLDLSVILFVVCITVIIGGVIKRATANSKAKAYAEYVEECKKSKKKPLDYVSWERLEAAASRSYVDDDDWE